MGHYFINDENLKSEIKTIEYEILNRTFTFYTDHGVFSKNEVDFGTALLLQTLPLKDIHYQSNVLDLGCGYGVVGVIISNITGSNVDMVDINLRALELAKKNAEKNRANPNIFESNAYENITKKYHYIITNPPIRAGKVKVYEMLFEAKNHLEENGELWLVVRKEQGAKSLIRDMEKEYLVTVKEKSKGFFVILCKKHWHLT